MRKHVVPLLLIFMMALASMPVRGEGHVTVDKSRPGEFIDFDVHALVGGSYITENYVACYPEISDLNGAMGPAFGVGAGVRFNIRGYLGLGTELNFTRNVTKMDMAVVGSDRNSVSNVFQRNTYYKVDVPVYLTFMFRLSGAVKWNVDAGMYYSYGTGGKQKNTIYDTRANELGQLMLSVTNYKADFYNDSRAFINSYHRRDIGIHLATGLTFGGHLRVGVRTHIGCSNIAYSTGIVKPSSHTLDFLGSVGWQF